MHNKSFIVSKTVKQDGRQRTVARQCQLHTYPYVYIRMLVVRTRTLYDFVGVEQLACVIIMTIHIIVVIIVVLIIVGKLNFYAVSLSLPLCRSLSDLQSKSFALNVR